MNYHYEERSAIKEYDGGMDRETAEDQAFDEELNKETPKEKEPNGKTSI